MQASIVNMLAWAAMNRLPLDKRTSVIAAFVEGTSINAACRIAGVAKHTALNLSRDLRVTPAMQAGLRDGL
jgi:hypothetical protein